MKKKCVKFNHHCGALTLRQPLLICLHNVEVKQKMQGWAWRIRGDTAEPGDSARVLCGRRGRVAAADREVQFGACFGQADEQELLRMAAAGPWEGLLYRAQRSLVSPCSISSVPLLL